MANEEQQLSLSQKYIRGEAHYGFWGIASRGTGFLNTLITITSLSLYQYGVFQLVLSLYGAATYFTSIGDGVVNNDIAHFIREKREGSAKKLFYEYSSIRIITSIILWAVFFFGANLFAAKYSEGFVQEIRIVSFLFLTEVFFNATESLLASRLNFAVVASRQAITKIAQLAALLFFLFFGKIGLQQMFLSMIFGSIVSTLAMVPAFVRLNRHWTSVPFTKEKILPTIFATYGKWDLYRQFFGQAVSRVQPWLIKIFVSTEAVAIFSVASAFIGVIKDIGFPIKTLKTLVPLHLSDKEKNQQIFIKSLRYIFALSVLASLGALVAVPLATKTFFPKYLSSLPLFYLMLVGIPVTALGVVCATFLIALRKQKFLFWSGVLKNTVALIFYAIFLPLYGLWGLAIEEITTPFVALLAIYFYLIMVRPGVQFEWRQLVVFDKEDWDFIKIVYKDARSVVAHKFWLTPR